MPHSIHKPLRYHSVAVVDDRNIGRIVRPESDRDFCGFCRYGVVDNICDCGLEGIANGTHGFQKNRRKRGQVFFQGLRHNSADPVSQNCSDYEILSCLSGSLEASLYRSDDSSSFHSRFWSFSGAPNSHSQTTTTRHPAFLSTSIFFWSLTMFPVNFASQKSTLLFGV